MRGYWLLLTAALLLGLGGGPAFARGGGRGGRGGGGTAPRAPSNPGGQLDPGEQADAIDWQPDYEEAARDAAEKKLALMVLFTTHETERRSFSCRFTGLPVRKAVRDAKVIPVRIYPPVALTTEGLSAEEAKKREAVFKESQEKYTELVKRLGASKSPTLLLVAPDGAKLTALVAPGDEEICDQLKRLPELLKAHEEALAKKPDPAGKPKPDPAAGAPVTVDTPKKPDPPAEKPKPGTDDDF